MHHLPNGAEKLASIGRVSVSTSTFSSLDSMATATDDSPDTLGTSSTLTEDTTAIIASFDPALLIDYLTDLAKVMLNASREDLQVSLLSYPDTLQRCSRFAADQNSQVLYLRKEPGDASSPSGKSTPSGFLLLTVSRSGEDTIRVLLDCRLFCGRRHGRHCRRNETSPSTRLERLSPTATGNPQSARRTWSNRPRNCGSLRDFIFTHANGPVPVF